jgi:ABC-type polysaccharide/polyol phosphate transport system ATPase subunit
MSSDASNEPLDNIAIQADSIGKCYRIYSNPKDRLKQAIWRTKRQYFKEFWALKDISFQIERGETVGIIGRNGSGKSTLLQIVCGTLRQTNGLIRTSGRIAALLELGSGFNPEFTGRENIAINARLLGLSEAELGNTFDQIVDFSEIRDFIDQPVKTYSSGMFVRLAFAIASHSNPDILIVDEALSVGDIAFQNKCITRIKLLRERGMTLVFVSHDLSTLQLICDRALWIHNGQLKAEGDPVQICQEYYALTSPHRSTAESHEETKAIPQQETGMGRFIEAQIIETSTSGTTKPYRAGSSIQIKFTVEAIESLGPCVFNVSIYSSNGTWVVGQTSRNQPAVWEPTKPGERLEGMLELTKLCLAPGDYKVALSASSEDLSICYALSDLYISFSVRSDRPTWGLVEHPCQWHINTHVNQSN